MKDGQKKTFKFHTKLAIGLIRDTLLNAGVGDNFAFDRAGTKDKITVSITDFVRLLSWCIEQTQEYSAPVYIEFHGEKANELALVLIADVGKNFRNQLYSLRKGGLSMVPKVDCGWDGGPGRCYWTISGQTTAPDSGVKKITVYSHGEISVVPLREITSAPGSSSLSLM